MHVITFLSKKGIALIGNKIPERDSSYLTIENSPVWDTKNPIYIVYDDGATLSLLDDDFQSRQFHALKNSYLETNKIGFVNQTMNPDFAEDISAALDIPWDEVSLQIIRGRWVNNSITNLLKT